MRLKLKNFVNRSEIIVEMAVVQPFAFNQDGLNGGTSTKIVCTITAGDSPLEISWFKGDQPLVQNDKIKVVELDEMTSMLSMKKLDLEDSGTYTCQASNAAGVTKHSSSLRVKGIHLFSIIFIILSVLLFEFSCIRKKRNLCLC